MSTQESGTRRSPGAEASGQVRSSGAVAVCRNVPNQDLASIGRNSSVRVEHQLQILRVFIRRMFIVCIRVNRHIVQRRQKTSTLRIVFCKYRVPDNC